MTVVVKRLGATILLLATALVARAVYAVPVTTAAQLRAVASCTQHRGTLPSPDDAGRCCGVASDAQDPARTVAAPLLPPPALTSAPLVSLAAAMPLPAGAALPHAASRSDPPLYLTHLSLRN